METPVYQLYEKRTIDLEKSDPQAAIKKYREILQKEKLNSLIYNRLMILYRKQKEYKKEQAIIKTAIKAYEDHYEKHRPSYSARVERLSKALAISTGVLTKKGKSIFDPEPVATWKKRLLNLNKKIK